MLQEHAQEGRAKAAKQHQAHEYTPPPHVIRPPERGQEMSR